MVFVIMQGAVESIVNGLFSALVTLGTVPVIKCPKVRQALAALCNLIFDSNFSAMYEFVKHTSNSTQASFSCMHGAKSLTQSFVCTSHAATNTAFPQNA